MLTGSEGRIAVLAAQAGGPDEIARELDPDLPQAGVRSGMELAIRLDAGETLAAERLR